MRPRAAEPPGTTASFARPSVVDSRPRPSRPLSSPRGRGAAPAAARRPVGSAWRKRTTIACFLLPATALYVTLVLIPIVQGAYYSGFDWNGLEPLTEFIGLQNYRDALADPVFLASLRHVFVIMALSLAVQLPFALALAVLLSQRMRGRAVLRMLFFLPFVLSEVITGVVWRLLLQPSGLVDQTIESFGLGRFVHLWLADPDIVLYTVFVVVSWKYFGFHMILYLAGLRQIPRDLEEAAALDGATKAQTFRHVTLPLLGPTIRISVFLSVIGSLQLFDVVWVMTGGGPVNALEHDGRVHDRSRVQAIAAGLRQRGGRDHVRHLLRGRADLPTLRDAP